MAIHCFKKDAVGLVTLCIVYGMMLVGNLLFLFSAGWPMMRGYSEVTVGVVAELLVFELLWFLMLWSHTYCMTTEPGFIPKNYRYQLEKLPNKFKEVISPTQSLKSSNGTPPSTTDMENQLTQKQVQVDH